jgi:hypothetical protein
MSNEQNYPVLLKVMASNDNYPDAEFYINPDHIVEITRYVIDGVPFDSILLVTGTALRVDVHRSPSFLQWITRHVGG